MQHFTCPVNYWVFDDWFEQDTAAMLSADFIDYDNPAWFNYNNPLENKKTLNNWWYFPPVTYKTFQYLNSQTFINTVQTITGCDELYPDAGLHGAGWHIHETGGKLNIHLDYSIHPKLQLERKLNLIIYLTPNWNPSWGGNLEFWSHNPDTDQPASLIATVENKFNRAVLFDTTQNTWHGFPSPLTCPPGVFRKSIATYYLTNAGSNADRARNRAKYAPAQDQINDPKILSFIKTRANS